MSSMLRAALALVALGASAAAATVVELPTFAQAIERADVIARVRVSAQQVEQGKDGRLRTWTTLIVVDAVAGASIGEQLTLYQPGGAPGDKDRGVGGLPVHRLGDDVVLFLARVRVVGRAAVIHRGVGYGVYDVTGSGALVERRSDVARISPNGDALPTHFPSLAALRAAVVVVQAGRRP